MHVWLASYPRSGNTFFRILLKQLYGLGSQSQFDESEFPAMKHLTGSSELNLQTEPLPGCESWQFVKTHDLPGSDQHPAIYLVRDGRDALVSHTNYIINHEKYDLPGNADVFWYVLHDLITTGNYFGGWAQNVAAWLERKAPTVYVRFEELITSPGETTQRAFKQLRQLTQSRPLGLRVPAVKETTLTTFAELQTQLPLVFRRGKVGAWHDEMPEELHDVFWQHHGTVMEKLGYSKSGALKAIELAKVAAESSKGLLSLAAQETTSQTKNSAKRPQPKVTLTAVPPIKLGELQLFHDYSQVRQLTQLPEVSDFYALLNGMRQAVLRGEPVWTSYDELVLYASVCFWMIRKLEYSFAARAFNALAQGATKLNILDVGCGVVPLCNWMAKRGHLVTAIDPTKSHIEFAQTHLNDFFQSEVSYETAHAEKLPYPDATFDIVTCISVLEHIPPGNDGLALLEIARILKPGGYLILTFDVSPETLLQNGEASLSASPRRFRYPFTYAAVEKLFEPFHSLFDFSPQTLITPFRSLTWDRVHQFWALTQHHDERTEPLRKYLAAGIVMQRTNGKISKTTSPIAAFITGQAAIEQQLDFFEYHATQRLQAINQLVGEGERLQKTITTEVAAKDAQIKNLVAAHSEHQTSIQKYAEERQALIGETSAIRNIFEEQTRLLQQSLASTHREYQAAQQTLAELTESLYEKKAEASAKEVQIKSLMVARTEDQARIQKYATERESLIAETGAIRIAFEGQIAQAQRDLKSKQQEYQTTELKLAGEIQKLNATREKLNRELVSQSEELTSINHDLTHYKAEAGANQSLADSYQRTIEEQTRVFQFQQEAHQKALENANLMAEARLRVIEEQQTALAAYRRWSIKGRLKNLVQPQLGVLYQYAPKPIELPAKYRTMRPLTNPPRISIVTPSYNQGGYIERTIQSVLGQDYPNLEYVIQDGASKDETMQVVEKYASNLKHYESVRDSGQTQAINLGFRHATGEIMAYLNSDDLLLPGALNYVASYFIKHPEIDVVYGHRVIIDEYDQEVGRWVMPPHENEVLSWADYVPQETLFWRRSAWEKAGNTMDESFRFAMDWDLILRLRDSGARMKRLPRFLGAFRVHPHQKTSAQISDIGNQEMARLRERCAKRPVSQAEAWQEARPYLKKHIAYRTLHRFNPFQRLMIVS